jgi:hypothetical protein
MRELRTQWSSLLTVCPELAELRDRLGEWFSTSAA